MGIDETVDLVRRDVVASAGTIVIKIGTNVLTGADQELDLAHLGHLADQIAQLRQAGKQVVVVSSGAIGAGLGRLGMRKRPAQLPALQAAAAIGQSRLMEAYNAVLARHGLHAAQLLLTTEDFNHRTRYLNARNTILQLLRWNAVPIINENDTVSVSEIRFGDNDQLAAMVTNLIRAPLLVILSVVDGLYPADVDPGAGGEPIDKILSIDEGVLAMAGPSTSGLGTGGMRSKLAAARLATSAGESVWIANGKTPDILLRILSGARVGTLLTAEGGSLASWKRWIGMTAKPKGALVVDSGARKALVEGGRSLLAVGVVEVRGPFEPGDVVSIECPAGSPFARGLTNYSAEEADRIKCQSTARLGQILPGSHYDEVIHRDNLVVL